MTNANIILSGQTVNALSALDAGTVAGQRFADARHTGQYRNALAQYGAGALQGDQQAMSALAQFDPAAMQGLQAGQLNMDNSRAAEGRAAAMHPLQMQGAQLGIQATQQSMEMARQSAAQEAASAAAQMDQAQIAQAGEQLSSAMTAMSAAQTPQQWDQYATELGLTDYVGRFADRDFLVARATGTLEGLSAASPQSPLGKFFADQQAGLIPEGVAPPQSGTNININTAEADPASQIDPSSPGSMIASIDGLLGDPDLAQGLGVRGAFNSRLGPAAPNAVRVQGRMDQLDGQAFLNAFESLKGGGQITEIEGQKATAARARLNRAQSVEDYRTALMELREIMVTAQSRPVGWLNTPEGQAAQGGGQVTQPTPEFDMSQMTDEQLQAIIDGGGQ